MTLLRILSCTSLFLFTAACVTPPDVTIQDKLVDIGIPENRAYCMGQQLQERLTTDDLATLAAYMKNLSVAQTAREAVDRLLEIDNPHAVGAITASAISCVFAPQEK